MGSLFKPITDTFPSTLATGERTGLSALTIAFVAVLNTAVEAQTIDDVIRSNSTDKRICVGCIPIAELMRINLSWDSKVDVDLDMHVFGPDPEGKRREIYFGNKDNIDDPFGRQRCDDLDGNGRGDCEVDGEKFNVYSTAPVMSSPNPYCVAVRVYNSPSSTPRPWQVLIGFEGKNIWRCKDDGKIVDSSESVEHLSPECQRVAKRSGRNWLGLIELDPLNVDPEIDITGTELPKTIGGVKCERL